MRGVVLHNKLEHVMSRHAIWAAIVPKTMSIIRNVLSINNECGEAMNPHVCVIILS